MPAYEDRPESEAKGGIVVIQEGFGVTRHMERIVERLAATGWHAVAPALYHREGSPVFDYTDLPAVRNIMKGLSAGDTAADVAVAIGYLQAAGWSLGRQGIVGFCMGGSVAFFAAVDNPLGAAVTFYGSGISEGRFGYPPQLERAGQLQTPWLGLYGDLDKSIPPDQVESLRATVTEAKVLTEVVLYPGADHGFNCNDRENTYEPTVAEDAWRRTLAWFDAHLAAD
jgi:carboxymethylenebutenolidase